MIWCVQRGKDLKLNCCEKNKTDDDDDEEEEEKCASNKRATGACLFFLSPHTLSQFRDYKLPFIVRFVVHVNILLEPFFALKFSLFIIRNFAIYFGKFGTVNGSLCVACKGFCGLPNSFLPHTHSTVCPK